MQFDTLVFIKKKLILIFKCKLNLIRFYIIFRQNYKNLNDYKNKQIFKIIIIE